MADNIYTVKQVNSYIKHLFTGDYLLKRISVKGEVSNCKYHSSGHIYFSLKDESGTIACVMFAGKRGGLSFHMKEGDQVVVSGEISVYERDGRYQLYAGRIEEAGKGQLYEQFLRRKRELEEMGMFDPGYKKPIPVYARTVGIVTAATGAAVHDIINVAGRRNPFVQLILYPAKVQGEGAAQSVADGIKALEKQQVDVMIVGRGGGSIEDLWAFNEEIVARAIFECTVPVISAVGHETDVTIADFVADMRTPTPSAAAELAVWDAGQTRMRLEEYRLRFRRTMEQKTDRLRLRLREIRTRLTYLHPRYKLQEKQQRLTELEDRLKGRMQQSLLRDRHRMELYIETFRNLSPLTKLMGGYAYVEKEGHQRVKSIREIAPGEALLIHVTDGVIRARAEEAEERTQPYER